MENLRFHKHVTPSWLAVCKRKIHYFLSFVNIEKQRVFGLDFIRAAAVLAVVFHHSLAFAHPPAWVGFFGPLGSLGVEILLVLSGYLIGRGLIQKVKQGRFCAEHIGQFYARRWLRTLPPYYLFLFIMAALFAPMVPQLITHKEYFIFMQNFAWEMPPFYAQTWTLALLEFFYLLFPMALFLSSKLIRHHLACFLIPILFFLGVPILCRTLHTQVGNLEEFQMIFRKQVIFHIDTPITGVIMGLIEGEFPFVWAWILRYSAVGLTAFSAAAAYFLLGCPYLSSSHCLQVFFFPLVSIAIALLFPLLCNWKENSTALGTTIKAISQVSYSLYVSHYFALSIGLALLIITGASRDAWMLNYLLFITLIVLIAYPTYLLAEKPFMRLRESREPRRSRFIPLFNGLLHVVQMRVAEPLAVALHFHHKPARVTSH